MGRTASRHKPGILDGPSPPHAGSPVPLGDEPGEPAEVLIKEARRRQRRRRGFALLIAAAAGGLVAGLLLSSGSPPPPGSPKTTPSSLPPTAKTTTGPTTPSSPAATARSSSAISLVFSSASPLMGVVALAPAGPGSGTSALYVTHDFVTYRRIALPVFPATVNAPLAFVSGVAFPTPTVGWAVDVAPGSGVYLFETTDGGNVWRDAREVHAEANGAFGWVRFVTATVGWAGAGDVGANGSATLLRTVDGGRTWQTLPGRPNVAASTAPHFVGPTVGFVHGTPGPSGGSTQLLRTTDGGAAWSPVAVPVAASPPGTAFPALPLMVGTDGVLPLVVGPQPRVETSGAATPVAVAFDTTSDGGRTWAAGPALPETAPTGFSSVLSTAGWIAAGPAAAVATPTAWWVVSPKATGQITVRVTHDAGSTWKSEPGSGLPALHVASVLADQIHTPLVLQAVSAQIAFLRVETSPQGWSSYVTTDGGAAWSMLTSTTMTTLPATRELETPRVRVSPSTGLVDGQTVTVSVSGFGAHGRYHVSECATDADVSEAGCGNVLAAQPAVRTGASGAGSARFVVSSSAAAASGTTSSEVQCTDGCVLVVSGGLGHVLALAPLTFGH